jgi:UDP-N-acetylmuramoyl-tripeptide--D-alanyl-D-alanine ligase
MRMKLGEAAVVMHATGLPQNAAEMVLTGVSIDSRSVRPGDLFFCLPGQRTDGHDHALHALERGAAAIAATRPLPDMARKVPMLLVHDGVVALGQLAAMWRSTTTARVVGVTGSAGKTTVKEMLAQVCSLSGETCKNYLNWNNQIGLPVSILSCSGREDFWILEVGISRPGDMEELGRILAPDLAVLLNAGAAHLAELGSVARVAAAKATLLRFLRPGGVALVNRDFPALWSESMMIIPKVNGFSMQEPDAEFYSKGQVRIGQDMVLMELLLQGRRLKLTWSINQAPLPENVLAVAAAATLLGIDPEIIHRGLTMPMAVQGRFQVHSHGRWVIVDDTYNANPLSVRTALTKARELAGNKSLVCVLGDMLELGSEASAAHRELGALLANYCCSAVFYHGSHSRDLQAGLNSSAWTGRFAEFESSSEFLTQWKRVSEGNGVVLFKGSRAGNMEIHLEALRAEMKS